MFYGQNKEDEIINNLIISKYGENFKGTILDVGANDGITLSNSRYFIENGWQGVLVEAGRLPYLKLMETLLPNTIAINCGLGFRNETLTFYESKHLLDFFDLGLVSSFKESETERWRKAGVQYTEHQMDCYDWNTFLDKYHLKHKNFDIITIDIEGFDYDLLIQMNLEELGCKVLCVEHNGIEMQKFVDYAVGYGMTLVHFNPENVIFLK
jgi:FkbM family methyltransferase